MPPTCRATTQSLFPPAASLKAKGRWKGEQNVADPYNTYWPAAERNARLTQAVMWDDHKGIMLNERSQTPKASIAWFQLVEVQSKLLSTESRLGLPGVGRRNEKRMPTTPLHKVTIWSDSNTGCTISWACSLEGLAYDFVSSKQEQQKPSSGWVAASGWVWT